MAELELICDKNLIELGNISKKTILTKSSQLR